MRPTALVPASLAAAVSALSVAALLSAAPARAQGLNGFLAESGSVTFALSHTMESYDEYWVGTVSTADPTLGTVETGTVSLWFDAGLCRNVALTGNLAYADMASDGPAPLTAQGLQDRMFLLRWRFASPVTGRLTHRFVAGAGLRAPASPYEPNRIVAIGDATFDQLLRLVYQIEADALDGAYLAAELGYDVRGDDAPDGTSIHGELGATLSRVTAAVQVTRTFADGGFDIGEPGFTFPGLRGEWLRLGAKLYGRVSSGFGLAVSGFVTPDGRNVGEASGMSTSIVVQL